MVIGLVGAGARARSGAAAAVRGWRRKQDREDHQPDAPQHIADEVGEVDTRQIERGQHTGQDQQRGHGPEEMNQRPAMRPVQATSTSSVQAAVNR